MEEIEVRKLKDNVLVKELNQSKQLSLRSNRSIQSDSKGRKVKISLQRKCHSST